MVPPWISILAVLHDFVLRVNLTEANIFTDSSYRKYPSACLPQKQLIPRFSRAERDAALVGMLSNTGLKNKLLDMATNETDIQKQLSEMKRESIKTNLMIASIPNLENYFTVAKPEMEQKRFTWFVFTKVSCGSFFLPQMVSYVAISGPNGTPMRIVRIFGRVLHDSNAVRGYQLSTLRRVQRLRDEEMDGAGTVSRPESGRSRPQAPPATSHAQKLRFLDRDFILFRFDPHRIPDVSRAERHRRSPYGIRLPEWNVHHQSYDEYVERADAFGNISGSGGHPCQDLPPYPFPFLVPIRRRLWRVCAVSRSCLLPERPSQFPPL